MNSDGLNEGKLGDIAEIIMGQSPEGSTCNEVGVGIPLLNGPTEFGGRYPFPVQFTTDPRKYAEENDLLFCVRGSTTGKMNWADQRYAIGRGIAAIRHKNGKDYQGFTRGIIEYKLDSLLTEATGSTFPNVSRQQIENLKIPILPLSTQRRIAAILTTLDDKIELNRRMNETLEGIAQALWGEWFGKYASGEEGNLCTLGEFITIKHGFAFKGENISDINGDNILVTPGNFSVGGGFNEKKLRYFEGDEFPKEYILNAKDLILTMTDLSRDGDTLGYPAFVPEMHGKKLLHNQRIGLVQFRNARLGKYFLYGLMKTNEYRSFILGGATGSTVRHTSPGRICDFKFPEQDKEKITEFELVADGLHNLVELNLQQSRTLTALRDALLPRLMRGEVMF
jgi:type I restriction enzyme S subunit